MAALSIDPPNSVLTITNAVPETEDFTATLTYPDGTTKDVTADTAFSLDNGAGTFAQHTLTVRGAGKSNALGVYTDKQATAVVIVHSNGIRVDPSLPPNTPDLFGGPEVAARAPTVVYPAPDVVMPRNLGDFEIHWTDANANDIFEISLHTDFSDVRVYVPGGNGDPAAGPEASWAAFLATEWAAAVGNEATVTYQVRGVQSTDPGAGVGADAPRLVKLSNEEIDGGIYYWASAGDAPAPTASGATTWPSPASRPSSSDDQGADRRIAASRATCCRATATAWRSPTTAATARDT